ncbi:MAG: hypothetical protein ACI9J3_001641 [Parvicellaceae bacterium]|jgi:hypothetical protein
MIPLETAKPNLKTKLFGQANFGHILINTPTENDGLLLENIPDIEKFMAALSGDHSVNGENIHEDTEAIITQTIIDWDKDLNPRSFEYFSLNLVDSWVDEKIDKKQRDEVRPFLKEHSKAKWLQFFAADLHYDEHYVETQLWKLFLSLKKLELYYRIMEKHQSDIYLHNTGYGFMSGSKEVFQFIKQTDLHHLFIYHIEESLYDKIQSDIQSSTTDFSCFVNEEVNYGNWSHRLSHIANRIVSAGINFSNGNRLAVGNVLLNWYPIRQEERVVTKDGNPPDSSSMKRIFKEWAENRLPNKNPMAELQEYVFKVGGQPYLEAYVDFVDLDQ